MVTRRVTNGARRMPLALLALLAGWSASAPGGLAGPVQNGIAVFAALDKITGEITTLKVPIDDTSRFGTFRITPRTCHTRPPTEEPRTMAFVEIEEFTYDKRHRRVFSGWMNAESPGLHAVEHPLFDVWLTGCERPLRGDDAGTAGAEGADAPPEGGSAAAGKEAPAAPLPPTTEQP